MGGEFRVARPSRRPPAAGSSGRGGVSGEHAHDVGLLHDQEILAVELDLGARPLAEQHLVADLDVDRDQLAGLVAPARADRHHLALRRLLLGAVRNDDAAGGLLLGVDAAHDHPVMQGAEFAAFGHGFLVAADAAWWTETLGLEGAWHSLIGSARSR